MLSAQNITLTRGYKTLFKDLSFDLKQGQMLLLTGTNGSGKSSLMRVLAGFLPPTSGHVFWKNRTLAEGPYHDQQQLHYIGHLDGLDPRMTVLETAAFIRELAQRKSNFSITECLKILGLSSLQNAPIKHLSAGQKRKLSLSRLWLDQRPLWILDEPATSLDRASLTILEKKLTAHLAAEGSLVISTHTSLDLLPHLSINLSERTQKREVE